MRIIKLLLFGLLMCYFFNHVQKLPGKVAPFFIEEVWAFILCIVFVPVNWFLEWRKWQVSLSEIPHKVEKSPQFHAFAAGMVTGFFTPSMLGNFIGRMSFFDRAEKMKVVYLTQYGNLAQFTATMIFGVLACIALEDSFLPQRLQFLSISFVIAVAIGSVLVYLSLDKLIRKVRWINSKLGAEGDSRLSLPFKIELLVLSCLRHTIFTIQFSLLFIAFGASIDWSIILIIWQIYLIVTLIPSLFFGKILIRDSIAWLMLSPVGFDIHQVFSTTLWIWILNLLLPALVFLIIVNMNRKWAV